MYLAMLGIAVCQLFMIQNWIAGPMAALFVVPFMIYQIQREERLLVKYFGDDYRNYQQKTGMLWPKEDKMPIFRKIVRELYKNTRILSEYLWEKLGALAKNLRQGQ
jgi:hypothetical protein